MNRDEFDQILADREDHWLVSNTDFEEGSLVYGYTTERLTFHSYVRQGGIHVVRYDHSGKVTSHSVWGDWDLRELWPNKRAYPEACSAVFTELCVERGFFPVFTNWSDKPRACADENGVRFSGLVCPCDLERGGHYV